MLNQSIQKKILIVMVSIFSVIFLYNIFGNMFEKEKALYSVEETSKIINLVKSCRNSETFEEPQFVHCEKVVNIAIKNYDRLNISLNEQFKFYLLTLLKKLDFNREALKSKKEFGDGKNSVNNFALFAFTSSTEDAAWNQWKNGELGTTRSQIKNTKDREQSQRFGMLRIFFFFLIISFFFLFSHLISKNVHKLIRIKFKLEHVGITNYSEIINKLIFLKNKNIKNDKKEGIEKENDYKVSYEYLKTKIIESEDDVNILFNGYKYLEINKDLNDDEKKSIENELENRKKQYIEKINNLLKEIK